MSITTLSSRAFNQDASMARNAAKDGPVIITDRGRPPRVLHTFDDYKNSRANARTWPICWPCPTRRVRLILS